MRESLEEKAGMFGFANRCPHFSLSLRKEGRLEDDLQGLNIVLLKIVALGADGLAGLA